jgi:hypothetical protein
MSRMPIFLTHYLHSMKSTLKNLAAWTMAWLLSTAVATFGPIAVWDNIVMSVLAIIINLLVGIGMIRANVSLFATYDELQKEIHLKATGITLGLSLVLGISYSLLDISDVMAGDAEISVLVGLMGIIYLGSTWYINRQYS